MKSKVAFDIAYGGYKNEKENTHFICEISIQPEVMETSKVAGTYQPQPPPSSTPLKVEKKEYKPPRKRKAKHRCKIVAKITMKKEKQ